MTVRDTEVRLTRTEDNILDRLGYREYTVVVDGVTLDPKPSVINKPLSRFSGDTLNRFIDQLGGKGNPVSFYELSISRLIDETLLRSDVYWYVTRGTYEAKCLPVQFEVLDSRVKVTLGILKRTN